MLLDLSNQACCVFGYYYNIIKKFKRMLHLSILCLAQYRFSNDQISLWYQSIPNVLQHLFPVFTYVHGIFGIGWAWFRSRLEMLNSVSFFALYYFKEWCALLLFDVPVFDSLVDHPVASALAVD